ncbi:hypothetical protein FHW88_005073 [Mucilaginibacter sp. SG538B]|nr:hypothetical protein [Mucilaginibacter sp. SG538B]
MTPKFSELLFSKKARDSLNKFQNTELQIVVFLNFNPFHLQANGILFWAAI